MDAAEAEDGRPLRADAARNRERILVAASKVFADRGLEATLDDVADHAGVGVATVYRRFPNKEALVEAIFEKAVDDMAELAVEAANARDSWTGLAWFLEHATQRQAENLGLRDVMLQSAYGRDRVARAKVRIIPLVARLVERAQGDGLVRPDFVAADIPVIECMLSSVSQFASDNAPDLWRRYLAMILDGIRTHRSKLPPGPNRDAVEAAMRAHRRG